MRFGLWGPSKWVGEQRQKSSLSDFGVEIKNLVEASARDDLLKRARRSTDDRIAVFRLFCVATTVADLQDFVTRAHAKNVFFDELASGRRSDVLKDLLKMMQDAQLAYGGKWLDPERAAEMGLRARGILRNGKTKADRMPHAMAQKILNNHDLYPTLAEALHEINRDERYPEKWGREYVYRERRRGNLKLERRRGNDWD